jgi:hypothetical protein
MYHLSGNTPCTKPYRAFIFMKSIIVAATHAEAQDKAIDEVAHEAEGRNNDTNDTGGLADVGLLVVHAGSFLGCQIRQNNGCNGRSKTGIAGYQRNQTANHGNDGQDLGCTGQHRGLINGLLVGRLLVDRLLIDRLSRNYDLGLQSGNRLLLDVHGTYLTCTAVGAEGSSFGDLSTAVGTIRHNYLPPFGESLHNFYATTDII